jgi:hypothetical protein
VTPVPRHRKGHRKGENSGDGGKSLCRSTLPPSPTVRTRWGKRLILPRMRCRAGARRAAASPAQLRLLQVRVVMPSFFKTLQNLSFPHRTVSAAVILRRRELIRRQDIQLYQLRGLRSPRQYHSRLHDCRVLSYGFKLRRSRSCPEIKDGSGRHRFPRLQNMRVAADDEFTSLFNHIMRELHLPRFGSV